MAHRRHVITAPICVAPDCRRALWLVRGTLLALAMVAGASLAPVSHAQLPQMKPPFSAAYRGADPVWGYHTGRVLRLEDGSPIADAHVGATWIEYKILLPHSQYCVHAAYTRTDANGNFKFRLYWGERPFSVVAMKGLLSQAYPPFNISVEPGRYYVVRAFETYEEQQASKGKFERLHGPLRTKAEALRASGHDNLYLWDNPSRKPGSVVGLPFAGPLCLSQPASAASLIPLYGAIRSQLDVLLKEASSASTTDRERQALAWKVKNTDDKLARLRDANPK